MRGWHWLGVGFIIASLGECDLGALFYHSDERRRCGGGEAGQFLHDAYVRIPVLLPLAVLFAAGVGMLLLPWRRRGS